MDNKKFFYAIILLSKVLFYNEPVPFDALFSNVLVDKISNGGESRTISRMPKTDPHTVDAIKQIYSV